jgi:hypothetical protein
MISAIDPATLGSTLINQGDTTSISSGTSGYVTSLASEATFLAQTASAATSSSSTLNETLNKLVTTLQNLVASLGKLFTVTNLGSGSTTAKPSSGDPFSFLRPVDEEPVTIIPATPREVKGGVSTIGGLPYEDDTTPIKDETKPPPKTNSKAQKIGTALKKSNGEFLWKPQSEKDGKLAIVLPKALTGKVKSVKILSADKTKTLATGKFSGVGNGDREHFRFSKSGGSYPDGAVVVITLEDGSKRNVVIKDSAARYTR